MQTSVEKRNGWFDVLKGIGIIGILCTHTVSDTFHLAEAEENFFGSGYLMVQLFFIISGYFAFQSFQKAQGAQIFYRKKVRELVPICWISYLVFIINAGIAHKPVSLSAIISAFTFTNGIDLFEINSLQNWFIGTLAVFILLVPVLYKFIRGMGGQFFSSLPLLQLL